MCNFVVTILNYAFLLWVHSYKEEQSRPTPLLGAGRGTARMRTWDSKLGPTICAKIPESAPGFFFFFFCFSIMVDVNQKLGRSRMHEHPDSASQRPECNGPAPHCPARLFDHGARPAR